MPNFTKFLFPLLVPHPSQISNLGKYGPGGFRIMGWAVEDGPGWLGSFLGNFLIPTRKTRKEQENREKKEVSCLCRSSSQGSDE